MRFDWRVVVAGVAVATLGSSIHLSGQQPQSIGVSASGSAMSGWVVRVDTMLRDGSLDLGDVQIDTMIAGRTHERLEQRYEGLPVFGGELVRQMDGPTIVSLFGRLFENVTVPTSAASIDAAAAAVIAEGAVGPDASAGPAELGILPKADAYVLAYRMTVRSSWEIETLFVNARTGAIEDRVSRIKRQGTSIVGKGTGVLNDSKKVSANQTSSGFQALDRLRPLAAYTLDFHGSFTRFNTFLQTGVVFTSDIATSTSNSWTDGSVVDAHVYQGWVYDYYFKRFGRRGLDDRNMAVLGIVHPLARSDAPLYTPNTVGQWINNASYLGDGFMVYGDGDGRQFDFLAGGLDVVAHELTHGVTDYTSNLNYKDESGALNEAFSDIMGTSVEFFFEAGQPPQKGPNWVMGEDITRASPGYIRSLQNPISAGTPDHYSLRQYIGTPTDNGGVHFNCTIATHAFYLAVAGGRNRVSGITVTGVGVANIERMERIFYRAFAFLMGPASQFADARAATLQAASDLYGAGSNDRAQVLQAWTAVGVQ